MLIFPIWKKWIKKVIPYIEGKKILEVSFGSGYLLTQYARGGFDYKDLSVGGFGSVHLFIATKKE